MKKIITLLLALVLMATCFAGCAFKKQDAAVAGSGLDDQEEKVDGNDEDEIDYDMILSKYGCYHEKKIYSEATIDDNFTDDEIIIIMRQSESFRFNDYTVDDFPEVELESVRSLNYASGMFVKGKILGKDIVGPDGHVYRYDEATKIRAYNAMVVLTLKEKGKDKVLEAIELLEEDERFMCVGVNSILTASP